jgi:FkbM family methyltransferase
MNGMVTARAAARKALRLILRLPLRFLPVRALETLIGFRRSLLDYLPPGRRFVFKKYLGDIRVNVDTAYRIEREWLTGVYEPEMIDVIGRYVNPGDTCFDVGANAGAVSLALAKRVGPRGAVYAIEPGKAVFARLSANIGLNPRFSRVIRPYCLAFSDRREVRTWVEDPKNPGNASFIMLDEGAKEQMPLAPMDDFIAGQGVERIDFIKIDVEGLELEVITGALRSIERFKPAIYYETGRFEKGFWAEWKRGKKVLLEIERLLGDREYVFFKHTPAGLRETRYPDLSYNTLALHRSKFRHV